MTLGVKILLKEYRCQVIINGQQFSCFQVISEQHKHTNYIPRIIKRTCRYMSD